MQLQRHKMASWLRSTWTRDILFLIAVLGGLFFLFLGTRSLLVPEEGRYSEIIREMVLSHDYVTPYLDGVKYFEKPILFYWIGVAAVKLFGLSVWTLRSINGVFGVLGCLLTYTGARKLYDRWTGLYAAMMLAASGLYFGMVHVINLDISATFFISLGLFSFLLAIQCEIGLKRRLFSWLMFVAAAAAVLTKGLVGIVLPALMVGVWIIWLNQWRLLKSLYLPSGILLFGLLTVPWHVLVQQRHPEFFNFYFVQQQFLRYATTVIGHTQPIWFFLPVLILGFIPWIVFLPQAVKKAYRVVRAKQATYQIDLFMLIWASAVFVFFSFSQSKLVSYILPMFPPLAVLVAHYLVKKTQWRRKLIWLWCITAIVLSSLIPVISIYNTSSTVTLAAIIKPRLQPDDVVVTYKQYYQDLPFYLGRTVTVVNWRGELEFGRQHQDTHSWLIDAKTFWQMWKGPHRIYAITDQNELKRLHVRHPDRKLCVLGETSGSVLFTQC